jgi:CheY-like chemotaxis protein
MLETGSGAGALDVLQREPAVDLMLIGLRHGGMSGAELARRVQAKRPTLPVLFITGFADQAAKRPAHRHRPWCSQDFG